MISEEQHPFSKFIPSDFKNSSNNVTSDGKVQEITIINSLSEPISDTIV